MTNKVKIYYKAAKSDLIFHKTLKDRGEKTYKPK